MRYLQILLNQPQGYLFCLVEGPDKDACARVHQEAHGNIACNILEITESDFSALLANKAKDGLDFTLNHDGTLDTGNRAILAIDILGVSESYRAARALVNDVFRNHGGRQAESLGNQIVAVFEAGSAAMDAGVDISTRISEAALPVEVRMGVDIGPPLKERGNFFEDVCRSATQLSFISGNGQISTSSRVMEHGQNSRSVVTDAIARSIGPADEKFLNRLMTCLDNVWHTSDINITRLAKELGMSKSQLTRRLNSLTAISPNDFLKEFRLRKAIQLMAERQMNIAEVTMAIGFTNPSYFAKCFRKRFGKAPSYYYKVTV